MLDYPSRVIKDGSQRSAIEDISGLLRACRPQVVYTHNLADKHDTHVAVALRVVEAARSLAPAERPQRLYGCAVWRGLDWLMDADKVMMDLSDQECLQAALLGVFDSQISGGKRYDLASLARRRANATYSESHQVDAFTGLSFAMDLTPLMDADRTSPDEWVQTFIQRFAQDVTGRIQRLR